jgi:hypothetical protein
VTDVTTVTTKRHVVTQPKSPTTGGFDLCHDSAPCSAGSEVDAGIGSR